ncbi:MAG TPA: hypothetical protein VKA37_05855 [Halobacteriales archaeon]|nr:hypothetical protein [Halobacteriales archaeon]
MTDRDTFAEMAAEIETLNEAAARLRELGEAAEMPAIERNAKRVADSAEALADNLPPELYEE